MYYTSYGYHPFDLVLQFIVILLLIALAVRLFRGPHWHHYRGGRGMGWGGPHSALDLLEERYAKGEIGKEEFETKKKDLLS